MDWKLKNFDNEQKKILCSYGVADIFSHLLSNRDFSWVKNKKDISNLIDCPISSLEDSENISGMKQCKELFLKYKNSNAVIYGDYDADGIVSSFMCQKLLHDLEYSSVEVYLPSRVDDGYGLNPKSVENFTKCLKKDYKLILALDCGSSSKEQIEIIKNKFPNSNIIVIDHHIIDENKFSSNATCIVNPRQGAECIYSTGGLIYQLSRSCAKDSFVNPDEYLPYAAITTITDVSPMNFSNRIIVKNGLEQLKKCKDYGINSILEIFELDKNKLSTEDISFKIGPIINASGRIKVASLAFDLLKSKNKDEANQKTKFLMELNTERKLLQNNMADEAYKMFEGNKLNKCSALLYNKNWNPGIVGIVASKVSEKYSVPTICFGELDGKIKGSARSINGINIKNIMDKCNHIFSQYGGHEMAAGATLKQEFLDTAWEIFNKEVEKYCKDNLIGGPALYYDYEIDDRIKSKIDNGSKDTAFFTLLSKLEPYGSGNEMPLFRINNIFCESIKEWKSGSGSDIVFQSFNLPFYSLMKTIKVIENKNVDILFHMTRSFKSKYSWMMKIMDFKIK